MKWHEFETVLIVVGELVVDGAAGLKVLRNPGAAKVELPGLLLKEKSYWLLLACMGRFGFVLNCIY